MFVALVMRVALLHGLGPAAQRHRVHVPHEETAVTARAVPGIFTIRLPISPIARDLLVHLVVLHPGLLAAGGEELVFDELGHVAFAAAETLHLQQIHQVL